MSDTISIVTPEVAVEVLREDGGVWLLGDDGDVLVPCSYPDFTILRTDEVEKRLTEREDDERHS